jgi:hypothetical protein
LRLFIRGYESFFLNSKSSMTWLRGASLPCLSISGVDVMPSHETGHTAVRVPAIPIGCKSWQVIRNSHSPAAHPSIAPRPPVLNTEGHRFKSSTAHHPWAEAPRAITGRRGARFISGTRIPPTKRGSNRKQGLLDTHKRLLLRSISHQQQAADGAKSTATGGISELDCPSPHGYGSHRRWASAPKVRVETLVPPIAERREYEGWPILVKRPGS